MFKLQLIKWSQKINCAQDRAQGYAVTKDVLSLETAVLNTPTSG